MFAPDCQLPMRDTTDLRKLLSASDKSAFASKRVSFTNFPLPCSLFPVIRQLAAGFIVLSCHRVTSADILGLVVTSVMHTPLFFLDS